MRLFLRCPVALPWFGFVRDPGPHGALLRLLQARERAAVVGRSRLKAGAVVILWLAYAAREVVLKHLRYRGLERRDLSAPGAWRRLVRTAVAFFGDNICPEEFYRFRLYRAENWARRRSFFLPWQTHPLFLAFDAAQAEAVALASDKLVFWQRCRAAGLPAVPVLAAARAGRLVEPTGGAPVLPPADLVLKPIADYGGHGIEFLFHRAGSGRWHDGERELDARAVLARLCERAGAGGMLLQPRVANHPVTEAVSNGFLVTLRLITARWPGGTPRVFAACCRMPSADGRVANLSGHPVLAAIGLADGRLAAAEHPAAGEAPLECHPDSGERIEGRILPDWDATCRMVSAAHAEFGDFPTVGWDVVLTPEGPRLLEFNTLWAPSILQFRGHVPLGLTELPECLLANCRRWLGPSGTGPERGAGACDDSG